MTLNRLNELFQAEKEGKQIMMYCYSNDCYNSYEYTDEVKIGDCDLYDLVYDKDEDGTSIFYIKDEEDKFGNKITIPF